MKRSLRLAALAALLLLVPALAGADSVRLNYRKTTSAPEGKGTCVFTVRVQGAAGSVLGFTLFPGEPETPGGENGGEIRLREPIRLVSAGHENACDVWNDNRPTGSKTIRTADEEHAVVFQVHSHPDTPGGCSQSGVAFGSIRMSIPEAPVGTITRSASTCDTDEAHGNLFMNLQNVLRNTRTGRRVLVDVPITNHGPGHLNGGTFSAELPFAAAWLESATVDGNPCTVTVLDATPAINHVTCNLGFVPHDDNRRFNMTLIPRRTGLFTTTFAVEGTNNGTLFDDVQTVNTNVQQGVTRTLALTVKGRNGGGGTVNINPPGTTCTHPDPANPGATKTQCFEFYADGASVTLTAKPQSGSGVTWSGACTGNALTCTLTMNADKTVEARFQP